MYNALEAGLLSSTGYNIWMPIATAANVAQGAAALAFSLSTTDKKQRSVALPASLSAFLGITEPAIFGVNLRHIKLFAAGIIGGAAGGAVAGLLNVSATAYGITGIFGILITTHNTLAYLLVMAVAFAVSFGLTLLFCRTDKKSAKTVGETPENALEADDPSVVRSPLSGRIMALKDVPDATFAEGVLGEGAAVVPSKGEVVAPSDAVVSTLFETHHAIGLTLQNGAELLIHIGINTVELNGEGFSAYVSEGDSVKAGQTLLSFDIPFIESKGYQLVTPVVVTNPDEFASVTAAEGEIKAGETLLSVPARALA